MDLILTESQGHAEFDSTTVVALNLDTCYSLQKSCEISSNETDSMSYQVFDLYGVRVR